MTLRVVFDTSTVLSALRYPGGRLGWLRPYWLEKECHSLVSAATARELVRVLAYPKFRLVAADQKELLADYLPHCEIVSVLKSCAVSCRDPGDQPFLDLAEAGCADILVSSDQDLLALGGQTRFHIESPTAFAEIVERTRK